MEKKYTDSTAFLQEAFSERSKANRRYSLRSFARQLGLSPGGLSQILSRKKRLSVDRAHEIARRLGLNSDNTEQFLLLVQTEGTSNPSLKAELQTRLQELQGGHAVFDLSVDQFKLISDWYGPAVLVLFSECNPAPSRREAARRLGIGLAEVDATLDRLQRLELLERTGGTDDRPTYRRPADPILVEARIPNEALRNYYRGVLEKCEASIDSQKPDEKVIGGQTFAFDPKQLNEARKLTDQYLNALNELASRGKSRSEVYQVIANVFRLTDLNQASSKSTPSKLPRKQK